MFRPRPFSADGAFAYSGSFFMTKEMFYLFTLNDSQGPLIPQLAGVSFCDGTYRIERNTDRELFAVEYIEKGSGFLEVDGILYQPKAGDMYIAPGDLPHRYWSSADNPWVKYWINFSGPMLRNLMDLYGISGTYLYSGMQKPGTLFRDRVSDLLSSRWTPETHAELELLLTSVISGIASGLRKNTQGVCRPSGIKTLAEKLRLFLCGHISGKAPSLQEMADYIHRTPGQTIRLFQTAYGITPYDFLLSEKIRAAKTLLLDTPSGIRQIAAELGFQDEYYFSRLFKKKTGFSPKLFRSSGK